MNELPTVSPMPTDLTTATPAVAPLDGVPAPVAPDNKPAAVRGRVAGPRTVFIRAMLEDTDGGLTYSTALPLIQKAGFEIDENGFNVVKSAWKRAKHLPPANTHKVSKPAKAQKPVKVNAKVKAKRVLPEVTVAEAIAFVQNAGGLAKAETLVYNSVACLKAFKQLVKQTSRLAA